MKDIIERLNEVKTDVDGAITILAAQEALKKAQERISALEYNYGHLYAEKRILTERIEALESK